ncbi:hypothetical protein C0991_008252 [Blastosporella zonata]|nr:hypothetical protein C0991_008252 [Blastosporella zonata]
MDVPTLFASNLCTFSNNAITDLQFAGLTRDEPLSREALQVAAGLFDLWDQRPERLQDEDWAEEAAVMEAGQDLWTVWSLKDWAQEMPYYKFFSVARSVALADVNMTDAMEMPLFEEDNKDFETSPVQKSYSTSEGLGKRKAREISGGVNVGSGPSNARPAKISKTGSGQPSTKQAKAMVDISGAHATDKDSVDEGLEGDIAVRVRWSTRALVQLAPHDKRVEFREAEGPVMPAVHHCQGGRALLVPAGATAVLPLSQQRCRVQEFSGGHHARHPMEGARGAEEGEEGSGTCNLGSTRCGQRQGGSFEGA